MRLMGNKIAQLSCFSTLAFFDLCPTCALHLIRPQLLFPLHVELHPPLHLLVLFHLRRRRAGERRPGADPLPRGHLAFPHVRHRLRDALHAMHVGGGVQVRGQCRSAISHSSSRNIVHLGVLYIYRSSQYTGTKYFIDLSMSRHKNNFLAEFSYLSPPLF